MESDFGFDNYIMPSSASYVSSSMTVAMSNKMCSTAFGYLDVPTPPLESQTGVFDIYGQPSSPESCLSRSPRSPAAAVAAAITEKVNALPDSFLPEFYQYSKETYEKGPKKKKKPCKFGDDGASDDADDIQDQDTQDDTMSAAETRRQIHIQSEQKRRAQIKDGFDELRQHLPGCVNKKMSKAALLHRTVQHLRHLKSTQTSLLTELERLARENEQLKKFQESVLQKQALERMYPIGM